uniref:F9L1.38 n=1 Tax=Arabidopsis thaliana TaxID=3702 RepID=Q9XI26_ARATH|nr:F9L1.38 [Arabidopsis thaliana]
MAKDKLKPLLSSDAAGDIADTPLREKKHKKKSKKRAEPEPDIPSTRDSGLDEDRDGVLVDDTLNEPTIGDKLESLDLLNGEKVNSEESNRDSAPGDDKPPTAASVNVLLRQALHADDRSLLLDCLYNRDEQVIANSVAKLNSAEGCYFGLYNSMDKESVTYSFYGIMSQESSLLALNTMYQLIESRVSTIHTAVEVSSGLDLIVDDLDEEEDEGPVIYEDKDSDEDEEEGIEEAMETDEEADDSADEAADGVNDFEGFDDMSD